MQCINIYPPPKYNTVTVVSLKLVEYQIFMDYVVKFVSEIDGYIYSI